MAMPKLQPKKKAGMKGWERLVIACIVLGLGVVLLVWLTVFPGRSEPW